MTNPYQQYMEHAAATASPLELVTLLYRCAIDSIGEARRCLATNDIAGRVRPVNRAYDAVTELTLSLDRGAGGLLSRSLADLYDYIAQQIILGHSQQSDAKFEEASRLLGTLLEAWQQIANEEMAPPPVCTGPALAELHY